MNNSVFDAVVVGAGHTGLSASYYLKKHGLNHIVLERGRIGESWRSQRWDSFKMNTSNRLNALPGTCYEGTQPDEFDSSVAFASSLDNYVSTFQLPVKEYSKVLTIEKTDDPEIFKITVSENNHIKNYYCQQVIIASGAMNEIKVPSFAGHISSGIKQLHSSEYRNPDQLPNGAVLVVGSAQSGCQIAEDLIGAGRKVYLSTSMVARVPRRHRGKDIMDWLIMIKFFEERREEITDPAMLQMKAPQLTGTGGGRNTISLQALAQKGATILGKMANADNKKVFFQPNAFMHVKFADEFSKKVKDMIDAFILENQLQTALSEADDADLPDEYASCASSITSLDLEENNINSIIWTTGFNSNFSYIKLPVFDSGGNPKHQNGITEIEGLYFLGLPWLSARKSSIIFGIKDDAAFISEKVYNFCRQQIQLQE